jgi:hypothetical protein
MVFKHLGRTGLKVSVYVWEGTTGYRETRP